MNNILFEINYITDDKSLSYRVVYIVGRKLRGYKGDKTYPKVTQCLLFKNNLLVSFAEVVKCDNDKDNIEYAIKLVTKKVIKDVYFTDIRKSLWKLIDEELTKLKK